MAATKEKFKDKEASKANSGSDKKGGGDNHKDPKSNDSGVIDDNNLALINQALEDELRELSSTQRAAVLMLLLGEQQASDILRYMNPKEVQALGAAMVSVADLSQEAVNYVLDEFVLTLKKQASLGLGTTDYVEKVFKRALGEDKAASVLGRIMPGRGSKGLEILRWMDARSIADMIINEHPQVCAIILSVLEYDVSADVLAFLPAQTRSEIIQRIASLETVQPSAMNELETIMKQQFSSNSSAKSSNFGGIKTAAKILNFTKTELESGIISGLNAIDPDLCLKIQDNMFSFDNLAQCDKRSIQTLLKHIETDTLCIALKGSNEEVKEAFLSNMATRARSMFMDELEAKGPLRITDVEDAQKGIMRIARKLSDAGELMLAGRGDDFV
jgi:flagellar motor switch protein FliG